MTDYSCFRFDQCAEDDPIRIAILADAKRSQACAIASGNTFIGVHGSPIAGWCQKRYEGDIRYNNTFLRHEAGSIDEIICDPHFEDHYGEELKHYPAFLECIRRYHAR
jgi:hypothetical protein